MPGDVILAFGGYLAAEGLIGVFPLWVLTVAASVVGFMNMYWLGHKLENQIKQNRHDHFVLKFFNYNYIRTGKMWMNRYGQWVVFGNRFLAGTRSVISLTAGMSQLNITRTLVNAAISSALWNAILVGAGWFVRDNWPIIGNYLASYGKGILLLIIAAGLGRYLWLKMAPKK
jgi:membrane protein DedA with SNARE-associated domain